MARHLTLWRLWCVHLQTMIYNLESDLDLPNTPAEILNQVEKISNAFLPIV